MAPVLASEVINSSSILLKWKAIKIFYKPIVRYNLYYNENKEKKRNSVSIKPKNTTDDYEYHLTNLSQLTTYSISVSATNIFGEGAVSTSAIEQTSAIGREKTIISNIFFSYLNQPGLRGVLWERVGYK